MTQKKFANDFANLEILKQLDSGNYKAKLDKWNFTTDNENNTNGIQLILTVSEDSNTTRQVTLNIIGIQNCQTQLAKLADKFSNKRSITLMELLNTCVGKNLDINVTYKNGFQNIYLA